VTKERDRARSVLLQALESPRYERLTTGLTALAQQGAGQRSAAGHLPATVVVPDLLGQRHRDAVKAARRARRSGEPSDFHRLRIRCKRLRYTLEFVQEVYGDPAVQFIRHLARLQDLLGGLQDCEGSMERLHFLATRTQPPLSHASVFLMGAVAEESRREAAGLLHRARARVKVLGGEEWQRLAQVRATGHRGRPGRFSPWAQRLGARRSGDARPGPHRARAHLAPTGARGRAQPRLVRAHRRSADRPRLSPSQCSTTGR
jgi:CHAD domain-containing protein